jgi:hypothetical protein
METDRVSEELDCFRTIVNALAAGMTALFEAEISMSDGISLVSLATQLLLSDNNACRVESLLCVHEPTFLSVLARILSTDPARFNSSQATQLQHSAVQAVTTCLNLAGCTGSEKLKAHVRDLGLPDLLTRYVVVLSAGDLSALVEGLHVCAARLGLGDDLINAGAIQVLVDAVVDERVSTSAQRFALSTLCTLAQSNSVAFTQPATLEPLLRFLDVEGPWDFGRVAVIRLFSDITREHTMFTAGALRNPLSWVSRYWGSLMRFADSDMDSEFATLVEIGIIPIIHAASLDHTIMCRLWNDARILRAVGAVYRPISTPLQLSVLLRFVTFCTGPEIVSIVTDMTHDSRVLAAILSIANGAAPYEPDVEAARRVSRTATLVTAVLLAKNPVFRWHVRRLRSDYHGWLHDLPMVLAAGIETAYDSILTDPDCKSVFVSPIVDSAGLMLNSVAYVDECAPRAWTDMSMMEQVLTHLFFVQEKHSGLPDAHSSTLSSDSNVVPTPPNKDLFLTFATLSFAVHRCFTSESVSGSLNRNAFSSDGVEPLERWEAEADTLRSEARASDADLYRLHSMHIQSNPTNPMKPRSTSRQLSGKPWR